MTNKRRYLPIQDVNGRMSRIYEDEMQDKIAGYKNTEGTRVRVVNPQTNKEGWLNINQYDAFVKEGNQLAWYDEDIPASVSDTTEKVSALDSVPTQKVDSVPMPSAKPQRSGNTFTPLLEKTEPKQTPQFDGSTFSNQLGIYDNNEADVPLSPLKEKEERDEGVKDYADKVEKHMGGMVTAEEVPIFTSGLSEKQDVDLGFDFSNVTPEDIFRTSDAQFERINKRPPTMRESIDAYENNVKQIGQYYQRKASEEAKDISKEIKSLEEEIALYDKSLSIDGFLMPEQQAKLNESKLRLEKLKEEKDRINEKYLGSPLYKDYLKKEENIAKSDADRYRRELASESAKSTTVRTPFAPAYIAYEDPEKVRNLNSAVEMAEQRARIYGAPSRYDEKTGKIFTDFASAVGDVMSSKDFWTLGFTEIARNFDIRGIQEKLATANKALLEAEKRGIEDVELKDFGVSDEDMAALTEFFKLSDAVAARQEDTSKSYRAGQGFAENIPFMVEFAITGGITSGISKGVSVGLKKALTNAFKKSLGLVDDKIVSVAGNKVAANVLNNATEAIGKSIAGIPATLISPSTYNNLSQKLTEVDMSGNLVYQNGWDAVVPALADSYIERLSEAGVGNIASGSVGIAAKSLFKRLPKTKISNMIDFLSGSTFGKIAKATGFHGMLGEIEEEFFGNGLRLMTGLMDKEEFKDFASWDNMLVMAGSFLPMTLMGAASNSASLLNANSKRKSYRNDAISILENAGVKREDAKKFFSDTDIDNEDISSIAKRLKGLLKDSNAFLDSESGQKLVADITNYLKYDVVFNMSDSDKRKLILDSEAPLIRWRNSRGVNPDIEVVDIATERKNIDFHFDDVMPERDRESLSETIFKVAENGGSWGGDTSGYRLQKNDNGSYTLEYKYLDNNEEEQTKNYNFVIKPSREAEVERTIKSISGSRPKSKAPTLQRTNTPQQAPTSESTPTLQQAPAPTPTPAPAPVQQDTAEGNVTAEDVAERNSDANVDGDGNLTLISGRVNVDGRDIDFAEAVVVNETSGTYSVKLDSGDIVTVSKSSISPDAIKVVNRQEYEAKIADVESQAAEQAQQDVEVITGGEQQPQQQPQQVRVDYSDEEFASDEARAVIDDISSRVYDENGDMLEEEYAKLSPEEKYLLERDIYDTKEEADNAIAEKIAEAQKKLQNARKGGAKNKKKVLEAQRELKEYQDMANAAGIAIQEDVKVITPEQPQSGDGEKQVTKGTAQTAKTAQTQQEEGEEGEEGDVDSDAKGVEGVEGVEEIEDTEDAEVIVEKIDIDADDNAAINTLKNKGAGLGSRVLALAKIARTFGFGSQDKEKLSVKPTKSDVDKDKAGKAYNSVWRKLSRNKILDKQDLNYVITKLQEIDKQAELVKNAENKEVAQAMLNAERAELQEYLSLMNEEVSGVDIDAKIDASKKFRNIMKAFISERKMLGNKTVVAAEGAVATPREADADDVRTGDIKTHIKKLPTISILSRMKAIYNKISIFEKYNDMEQEEKRLYDIAKLINAAYVDMIPPKDFAKSEDIQGQLDNAYATYMRYVNIANGLTPVEVKNDTKWYDASGEEVNLEKFYSVNNSGNLKVLPKEKPTLKPYGNNDYAYAEYSNFYSSVKEQSLEYEGNASDKYYERLKKQNNEKDSVSAKTITSKEAGVLGRLFNAYMNELTNRVQYQDLREEDQKAYDERAEKIKELEEKKAKLKEEGEDVAEISKEIAKLKKSQPVGKDNIKAISSKWFQDALNLNLPSEQEMQNIIDAIEDGKLSVEEDDEGNISINGLSVSERKNDQKKSNKEKGFGAVSNASVKFVIEHYMKFKELIDLRDVESKSKKLTTEQVAKGKGNYIRLGQSNIPDYAKEEIKEYKFPTPVEFSTPGVNILESAEQYKDRVTKEIDEKIERLNILNDRVSGDNVSDDIKTSTRQAIEASIAELEEYKDALTDWYDGIKKLEEQESLIKIFQRRKENPKGKLTAKALSGRVKSLINAGVDIYEIANVLSTEIKDKNDFKLLIDTIGVNEDIANNMWNNYIVNRNYRAPFDTAVRETIGDELYSDIADAWNSAVNALLGRDSKHTKTIQSRRKASLFKKWKGFEKLKGLNKNDFFFIEDITFESKIVDGKLIVVATAKARLIDENHYLTDNTNNISYTIEVDDFVKFGDSKVTNSGNGKSKDAGTSAKSTKDGTKKSNKSRPKSKKEKKKGVPEDVTVEGKTAVEKVSLEFTKKDIEGTPLKVQGKYQSLEAAVQAQKLKYLSTDMSKEEKDEILKELKRTKDDNEAKKIGKKIKVNEKWQEDENEIRQWLEEYNKKQPNSIDLTDALKRSADIDDDNDNDDDGGDDGGGTPPPPPPTKGRGTPKSKGGSTAKSASKQTQTAKPKTSTKKKTVVDEALAMAQEEAEGKDFADWVKDSKEEDSGKKKALGAIASLMKKAGLKTRIISSKQIDKKLGRDSESAELSKERRAELINEANQLNRIPRNRKIDANVGAELQEDDIEFRLSRNNKATITGWLKKKGGLTEGQRQEVLNYLDEMDNPKLQLATAHWFCKGTIRLVEDEYQVIQALGICEKKKLDFMKYDSPMDIIDAFPNVEVKKEKPINPDTVKTLTNKREIANGITIYDVEESEEGRQDMRKIINTHFGKEASPWCLLQGDGNGNLTERSRGFWYDTYNAYQKQVAFKDGKLVAFSANSESREIWWDRGDKPYDGIAVNGKIEGDELGRSGTIEYDADTGEILGYSNYYKGNKRNGTYQEWHDSGELKYEGNYKDGKRDGIHKEYDEYGSVVAYGEFNEGNGTYKRWYYNGKLGSEENYKDDKRDGVCKEWYSNGELSTEENYKDGKLNGTYKEWYSNGKLSIEGNYKDGKQDGTYKEWYSNGELSIEENYKDGKLNGVCKEYDENGKLRFEGNYKDSKRDGICKKYDEYGSVVAYGEFNEGNGTYKGWYLNGKLKFEENYKDDRRNGTYKEWYSNGELSTEENYKDGKQDGVWKGWYPNGKLRFVGNYKDGKLNGVWKEYDENGKLREKCSYKNDKRDGICKVYDENGKLREKINYKDAELNGTYKKWYSNGQLESVIEYKDGRRNGIEKRWYENGQLECEAEWRNDNRNGVERRWYENGQLKYEIEHNGKRIRGTGKRFDENGQPMTELRNNTGVVLGYINHSTNTVYINEDEFDMATPIHEYTHAWARMMQEVDKEEWSKIVEVLKYGTKKRGETRQETKEWKETKQQLGEGATEDAIASEMLSELSGLKGKEYFEAAAAENEEDIVKAVKEKIKKALGDFWDWVASKIFGVHMNKHQYDLNTVVHLPLRSFVNEVTLSKQKEVYSERLEKAENNLLKTLDKNGIKEGTVEERVSRYVEEWAKNNKAIIDATAEKRGIKTDEVKKRIKDTILKRMNIVSKMSSPSFRKQVNSYLLGNGDISETNSYYEVNNRGKIDSVARATNAALSDMVNGRIEPYDKPVDSKKKTGKPDKPYEEVNGIINWLSNNSEETGYEFTEKDLTDAFIYIKDINKRPIYEAIVIENTRNPNRELDDFVAKKGVAELFRFYDEMKINGTLFDEQLETLQAMSKYIKENRDKLERPRISEVAALVSDIDSTVIKAYIEARFKEESEGKDLSDEEKKDLRNKIFTEVKKAINKPPFKKSSSGRSFSLSEGVKISQKQARIITKQLLKKLHKVRGSINRVEFYDATMPVDMISNMVAIQYGDYALGFVDEQAKTVYLNTRSMNVDTPFHEIGIHRLMAAAKTLGNEEFTNAILSFGRKAVEVAKYNTAMANMLNKFKSAYYFLDEGSDEFYEEFAANVLGHMNSAKLQKFIKDNSNVVKRAYNTISSFISDTFGKQYAYRSPLSSINQLGLQDMSDAIYDAIMDGKVLEYDVQSPEENRVECEKKKSVINQLGDGVKTPAEWISEIKDKADEYNKKNKDNKVDFGEVITWLSSFSPLAKISKDDISQQVNDRYYDSLPNIRKANRVLSKFGLKVTPIVRYLISAESVVESLERLIKKNGGKIDSNMEYSKTNTLVGSKVSAKVDEFRDTLMEELNGICERIINNGKIRISQENIDDYKRAKHAIERNRYIVSKQVWSNLKEEQRKDITETEVQQLYDAFKGGKSVSKVARVYNIEEKTVKSIFTKFADINNSKEGDNRSGYTTSEAIKIVTDFEDNVGEKDVKELNDKFREASNAVIKELEDTGLISATMAEDFRGRYNFYVPLRGWDISEDRVAFFEDFDYLPKTKGNQAQAVTGAEGRTTRSASPFSSLEYIAMDAIAKGESNKSRQSIYRMALRNQDKASDLIYVQSDANSIAAELGLLKPDGQVTVATTPKWVYDLYDKDREVRGKKPEGVVGSENESKHNRIEVYVDGKKYKIYVSGELGKQVAKAVNGTKNLSSMIASINDKATRKTLKFAWDGMRDSTRFFSNLQTTYRFLSFFLPNFHRDALIPTQTFIEHGFKRAAKVWLGYIPSIIQVVKGDILNNPSEEYEEASRNGYAISYAKRESETDVLDRYNRQTRRLKEGKRTKSRRGEVHSKFIDIMSILEKAVRYSAYQAAKKDGASDDEAAYAAHTVSGNFSEKGTQTALSGVLSFYNPTVQSLLQQFRNWRDHSGRTAAAYMAHFTLGLIANIALRAGVGDDDDEKKGLDSSVFGKDNPYNEMSENTKQTRLVIPTNVKDTYTDNAYGEVEGFTIHLPHNYRVLWYLSAKICDVASGADDIDTAAKDVANALLKEVNPVANLTYHSEDVPPIFVPSFLRPIIEAYSNTNYYGGNISRSDEARLDEYGNIVKGELPKGGTNEVLKRAGNELQFDAEKWEHILKSYLGDIWNIFDYATDVTMKSEAEQERYTISPFEKAIRTIYPENEALYSRVEELKDVAQIGADIQSRTKDYTDLERFGKYDEKTKNKITSQYDERFPIAAKELYDEYKQEITKQESIFALAVKDEKGDFGDKKYKSEKASNALKGIRRLNAEYGKAFQDLKEEHKKGKKQK